MKADCGVMKIRQWAGRAVHFLRDLMFLVWWLWRACWVVTPSSYIFSLFHCLFTHDIFFQTEGGKLLYGDIERNVISVYGDIERNVISVYGDIERNVISVHFSDPP